jgi:hypothetical protein
VKAQLASFPKKPLFVNSLHKKRNKKAVYCFQNEVPLFSVRDGTSRHYSHSLTRAGICSVVGWLSKACKI